MTYTPSGKDWNGQYRNISLSVKQHNYHLAYRHGYYAIDVPVKAPTQADFNQALGRGADPVNDVTFAAHLATDAHHIAIDYVIDSNSLQFATAADGGHTADVDLVVDQFDASGKLLAKASSQGEARVALKQWPRINQSGLPGRMLIPLEPKLAFLKLGIRDASTGRFGTLEVSLSNGASPH